MSETLLSIQEAASISGKSIQTIRRALKMNKLEARKKKTPQGFNYLITQDSLVAFYKLKEIPYHREQSSIKQNPEPTTQAVSNEFVTAGDLKKFEETFRDLLDENKKEKEKFMNFMKAFQDRFVVMENQLKLLEQPKRKSWYQFWR